ncbi:MAG: LytTR family transcriptional regulator, partial [Lachnospiraceae bacterium]|nr:LytTR family transcriptional regulator [Lachnospiraceae bacterium]
YMQRSFDVQAYHYLEKPAEKEKLYMILEHIINEKCAKNDQKVVFTDKYSTHYIRPDDLYYVDIDRSSYRNIRLHFDDDSILMHIKIKDCEKILRPFDFIYVYRSTLVNLKYLHIVGSDSVTLVNKVRLKLSRRHMQHVQEEYVRYNAEIISNKNKFL